MSREAIGMSNELIQFNSAEQVIGNMNVAEAVETDSDIVFNESYVVIGNILKGKHIHASYDLFVIGDIEADKITINGDLTVRGNIVATELICRGVLACNGDVNVKKIDFDSYAFAETVVGESIRASDNFFVRTIIDAGKELIAEGLVVAGEGILGEGNFEAAAAIVNEYFEFNGEIRNNVFEISEMDYKEANVLNDSNIVSEKNDSEQFEDVSDTAKNFDAQLRGNLSRWSKYEEEEFIREIRSLIPITVDLHLIGNIMDNIIEISYKREIDNFKDFLYVLCAKNEFPEELAKYETIEPVLNQMYEQARVNIATMDFAACNIEEFAYSLFILNKYSDQLSIEKEEGADKIFSSIGLRYTTVEKAWR